MLRDTSQKIPSSSLCTRTRNNFLYAFLQRATRSLLLAIKHYQLVVWLHFQMSYETNHWTEKQRFSIICLQRCAISFHFLTPSYVLSSGDKRAVTAIAAKHSARHYCQAATVNANVPGTNAGSQTGLMGLVGG